MCLSPIRTDPMPSNNFHKDTERLAAAVHDPDFAEAAARVLFPRRRAGDTFQLAARGPKHRVLTVIRKRARRAPAGQRSKPKWTTKTLRVRFNATGERGNALVTVPVADFFGALTNPARALLAPPRPLSRGEQDAAGAALQAALRDGAAAATLWNCVLAKTQAALRAASSQGLVVEDGNRSVLLAKKTKTLLRKLETARFRVPLVMGRRIHLSPHLSLGPHGKRANDARLQLWLTPHACYQPRCVVPRAPEQK